MTETVWLQRPNGEVPWGFRLQGGRDYQEPLRVQRVTVGSIAATGLNKGDVISKIGDIDTSGLTFGQSQEVVKNAGNMLQLRILKGGNEHAGMMPTSPAAMTSPQQPQLYQPPQHYQPPPQQQQQHQYQQAQPAQQPQFPTKLEQQLAGIKLNNYSPASSYSQSPQGYGGQGSGTSSPEKATPSSPQRMPDAIANMAAKGAPDKKPWSYAPDVSVIQEQRDKVRKRGPHANIPRYQQQLNMPNFEEPPPPQRQVPVTPPTSQDPSEEGSFAQHMQYNSPLHMYTQDNVEDAFKGQSKGDVTAVQGIPNKDQNDITQSPVYRMIHGMDSSKPKPKPVNTEEGEEDIGNYDEASIRYRGKNIPSKSFQKLQSMTGGPGPESNFLAPPQQGRKPRQQQQRARQQPEEPEQNPDDIVDIRFVGGNIPGRSFRMLQEMTGGPDPADTDQEHHQHQMNGDVAPEMRRDLDPRHHHQQPQQQSASAITSPRQLPEQNSGQRYTSPDHQGVQQPQPPVKPPTADDTRDAASVAAERRRMRRRQQSVGNDSGAETGPEAASTPMRPTTPVTPTSGQHQRMRTRPRTREEARQRAQTPESPLAAPPFHQGGYLGQTQPPAVAPIATNITKPVKVQTQPLVDLTKIPSTATKSETAASSPRFTRAIQRNTPTPLSVDLTKIPVTPVQMVSPRSEAVKSRSAQPVAVNHQPAATRQDDPYDGYSSVPIGQSAGHRQVPVSAPAHKGAPGPRDGYAPYTAPHGTAPTINGTAPRMMASPGRQTMTSPQAPMYNGPAPVRAHTPSGTGPQSAYQHRTPEPPPYSQYQDHPNPPQQRPQPVPHSPDVRIQTISKPTKSKQRRPKSEYEELEEFDESAYLRGRVPLITGEPATRRKALPPSENEQYMPGYDHEEDTTHKDPFDEQAFLQGKVSIFGGPVKPHPPKERQEEELEWTRNPKPALQDLTDDDPASQFDESAFLPKRTKDETEAEVEWKKHHKPALQDLPDGDPARHFDESAFIQKNLKDKTESEAEVEWRRHHKPALQDLPPEEGSKEFDEFAFLGRQRPAENDLVQEDEDDIAKRSFDEREFLKKKAKAADENDTNADGTQPRQFDEDSFLSGRAPSGPAPPDGRTKRRRAKKPEPEKKAPAEEEPEPSEPFDESDYLMGRVPLLKGSTDPAVNPPREVEPRRRRRQRAEWERADDDADDDIDSACSSDAEFDERAFLRGRVATVRRSVERDSSVESETFTKIPSRSFRMLRRSVSRDHDDGSDSGRSERCLAPETRRNSLGHPEDMDPDKAYNSMVYVGKKIPSKRFGLLKRSMDRKAESLDRANDPIEKLKTSSNAELDVDTAVEKLEIGKYDPDQYMDLLKKTIEEPAIKVEVEPEVTDF